MFDGSAALEMPDYFKTTLTEERRDDALNFRCPSRLKKQLVLLAQIWDAKQQIKTKRRAAEVTYSDAAIRLLAVGLAGAWEELEVEVDENDDINEEQAQAQLDELLAQVKALPQPKK